MYDLRLTLHGLGTFNESVKEEIIWKVKREFDPLVNAAGKHLRIMTGPSLGDLNIRFDSDAPAGKPCGFVMYGEDGGERVYVRAHQEQRVCSAPNPKTGRRDLRRVLTSDCYLARALANTAIHELGHLIAMLDHVDDPENYMVTGSLPLSERTIVTQRTFLAGQQHFTAEQKAQLIQQLKEGDYLGDLKFH